MTQTKVLALKLRRSDISQNMQADFFVDFGWMTEYVVPGWCMTRDVRREVWSSFGGAPVVALPAPPRLLLHKLLLKRGNTDVSHKVVPGRGTLLNHLNQRGFEAGRD